MVVLLAPLVLFMTGPEIYQNLSGTQEEDPLARKRFWFLLVDATFHHINGVSAYYCMSLLSPVSISVANTAKRALLIVLSILYFGNAVSLIWASGVVVVVWLWASSCTTTRG